MKDGGNDDLVLSGEGNSAEQVKDVGNVLYLGEEALRRLAIVDERISGEGFTNPNLQDTPYKMAACGGHNSSHG